MDVFPIYKCVIYVYVILYALSIKLTLSACDWQWSCTRYTWANDVDVGGLVRLGYGAGIAWELL